ncbi:MAG: TIGR03619 family F420-dependent LLM class oxidoreductase [Gammaproteobacteria bacterium]|jgi:probable F420-dependent oxidoreductase|nr:TIGR03619 family F420-dependent LLM class oxidoreductase [Gammaproteobacteria bacterium]
MDVGLTIPTRGPLATPQAVEAFARRADELGYAHLAVPDHVVVPRSIDSRYPYSASGEFPGAASGACFDQFTLLAFVAAINSTARLLTSVTVIPHRGAVHTAKTVATIDVLSQGRMILGVGAGWMKEEFEALGAPAFEERGRVTDEYLQAFKVLWTEDDPHFEGDHVHFANITFLPKPEQKPHPPIWVGGESPAALRRTVRYGDTWFPIGNNPRHPLDTVARFADGCANMRNLAEKNNRDPDSIGLAFFANWYDETKTMSTPDGQRHLLTGSAEEIAEDINGLSALGVRDLILNFQRDTLEQSLNSMQHFTETIQPLTPPQ